MPPKPEKQRPGNERISFAGVDPEEALRALMQVNPEADPASEAKSKDDGPEPGERSPGGKRASGS
jgi:hypothetical protein